MVQDEHIICTFDISGRWSYESNYTTLIPCLSWLENSAVQEQLPAVRHTDWTSISVAFYETEILMGSSAYSPLVRENQLWGRRICLTFLVEIHQKANAWEISILICQTGLQCTDCK